MFFAANPRERCRQSHFYCHNFVTAKTSPEAAKTVPTIHRMNLNSAVQISARNVSAVAWFSARNVSTDALCSALNPSTDAHNSTFVTIVADITENVSKAPSRRLMRSSWVMVIGKCLNRLS